MISPTSAAWLRCAAILLLLAAITAWTAQHQTVLGFKMETAVGYLAQGADELRDVIHVVAARILETLS
jgi:hypothetical protein